MLDIIAMILIVVEENLPFGILWTPWSDLFYALMFWCIFLLVAYCLVFNFLCVPPARPARPPAPPRRRPAAPPPARRSARPPLLCSAGLRPACT